MKSLHIIIIINEAYPLQGNTNSAREIYIIYFTDSTTVFIFLLLIIFLYSFYLSL